MVLPRSLSDRFQELVEGFPVVVVVGARVAFRERYLPQCQAFSWKG